MFAVSWYFGFDISKAVADQWSKIANASRQQIKALQEGLGAIRDVLLDGSQSTYLSIYRQSDRPQRQLQAKNTFLAVSLAMPSKVWAWLQLRYWVVFNVAAR